MGEFGSETTEVSQIDTINTTTHTLTLKAATKFPHNESSRVTIIKYNQVRFYHTTTATFSATSPVTGYIDIQPDSFFTITYDNTNNTGFGWFIFYNSTTTDATTYSNPIPYAGFEEGSVKKALDMFFSLLNNAELKLINSNDAFRWMNEAYAIAQNQLNLVNQAYTVPSPYQVTTASGTAEYALPSTFGNLISVTDSDGNVIDKIDIKDVSNYNEESSNTIKYYIRGSYIGFSPSPTSVVVYDLYHTTKASVLDSYYDNIDLPNNNFYSLVDWMMYRAKLKLRESVEAKQYKEAFNDGINMMKLTAFKQDANPDSWSIAKEANI